MDKIPIATRLQFQEPFVAPKPSTNIFYATPPQISNPWRWYIRWVASADMIQWMDVAPYDQFSTNLPTVHTGGKPFQFYTIAATLKP